MKASEMLRRAAEVVFDGTDWCGRNSGCWAIAAAARGAPTPHYSNLCLIDELEEHGCALAMTYYKNFEPNMCDRHVYWFNSDENDLRILALCFAAAIAESEGN